jgi:hypothetical protein
MEFPAVVLTSGVPSPVAQALPKAVRLEDIQDVTNEGEWVARTAITITAAVQQTLLAPPLLLVFAGEHARQAPHLGFAQRAARRSVHGYVLIDPVLPTPGAVSDWPDAPVTVILSEPDATIERDSRLRGWEVRIGEPVDLVVDIIAGQVDHR